MFIKLRLLLIAVFFVTFLNGQEGGKNSDLTWLSNLDEAVSQADKTGKKILLYFSGSDWCRPCMLLRLEVFDSEAFVSFAKDSLVLVQFDFPARAKNKLSEAQQKMNEQMAERFNKDGVFPKVLLLDGKAKELGAIDGYKQSGAEDIISILKKMAG